MKKVLLFTALSLGFFACQNSSTTSDEAAEDTTTIVIDEAALADDASQMDETMIGETVDTTTYSTRGQIVSMTEPADGMVTVTLDHEEIPDFMGAMRMDFTADDITMQPYTVGDKVYFEMAPMGEGYKITAIDKLEAETELQLKAMEEGDSM